jgi:tetratricopeptide (TPR) repeat protein
MAPSSHCRAVLLAGIACLFGLAGARADTAFDLVPDDLPITLSGSYLAGRSANAAQDIDAAAKYFADALEIDPENASLIERVLVLRLANGEIDLAVGRANALVAVDRRNPLARMTLAVAAIKQNKLDEARQQLAETADAPLAKLTAGLIEAWADQGEGKTDDALKAIDDLSGPTWYDIFKQYHHALIADLAGRQEDAIAAITQAYDGDGTALRVVEAYAGIMARAGKTAEAIKTLERFISQTPRQPTIDAMLAVLKAGKTPQPIATTPQQGVAEALYGLGSAIGTDQGVELPAAYLQLARYLDPGANLTLMAVGDLFQGAHLYDKAIAVYSLVPASASLHQSAEIEIGLSLDALDRTDEAVQRLKKIVEHDPANLEAVTALGNLYRSRDRFAEAADTYSKGIATIADPSLGDWRLFYFRGVSLERSDQWPKAEADLQKALVLNPDQPQVLNYLGYSWVDQGSNLDKAVAMIKTAVDLRPNDGYIVDSLGWAQYRMGNYQDAVDELERAIELKPADPVINDHLGDAYWEVGRKRDALFQWMHSRDLGPDKEELPKILAKIENGLNATPKPPITAETPAPVATSGSASAGSTNVASAEAGSIAPPPTTVMVEKGDSLWTIADKIYGDPNLYLRIYKANRARIADPNIIFPGMSLTIPAKGTN